ncbi:MAG: N-acyl homoserine lactonase QqlR [Anaerolineae bacterium]
MAETSPKTNPVSATAPRRTVSRRGFLRGLGIGTVGALVGGGVTNYWHSTQDAAPLPPLDAYPTPALSVTTPGGLRIHHLQTGYVAVKSAHRSYNGADGTGLLALAADRTWTEWMPITAWVIEHPEGVIVVDTGETSRALTDENYFACDPGTKFFYSSFLRFALTPEDEIGPQLAQLGIKPDDVRWVVQTHLHGDHVGGLATFPKSQIIVSDADYPDSIGTLPCHYPDWMNPTFSRFTSGALTGFPNVMSLTGADNVFIVPTPGHTVGHQSVVLVENDLTYFFAGDTSFDQAQMLAGGTAGIAQEPANMRRTAEAIRTYAQAHPTVYLPSHDPELRTRLQNQTTV